MKLSGYVQTRDCILLNVHYCVLFSSRVRVRIKVSIRFRLWLVSGYTHVFVLLSARVTLSFWTGAYRDWLPHSVHIFHISFRVPLASTFVVFPLLLLHRASAHPLPHRVHLAHGRTSRATLLLRLSAGVGETTLYDRIGRTTGRSQSYD